MGIACIHLEMVEANNCMFLSVLLLCLVHLVHLGLDYFAGTLVPLAEVGQGCLPTIRLHTAKSNHKYMSIASPTVEWK